MREVSQKQADDPKELERIRNEPNTRKLTLPVGWVTRKKLLGKIGFLDAEFFSPAYGEEADWNFRAHNKGYKIVRSSKSNAVHFGSATIRKAVGNKKYVVLINRHRLRAMLFNLSVGDLLKFVPGLGLILVKSVFDGSLLFVLKAYYLTLKDWRLILEQRGAKRAFVPFKQPFFAKLE